MSNSDSYSVFNNSIVYYELHSTDSARSREFFGDVFGWRFTQFPGPTDYWTIATRPEPDNKALAGMMQSRDNQPRTVNTIQVDNLDGCLEKITEHGGAVVVPRMSIGGVGYVAYCTDPGGVLFGVAQFDASAV